MIRVGPAGWSYPDWEGIVYPKKKGAGFHPLRHLARFVDCVELNSSFYATPRADYADRWVSCVEEHEDFRFVVKLQNVFTHEALPSDDRAFTLAVERFLAGIEPLRASGRLAATLVQFPLSFRFQPNALRRLARLEEAFGHLGLVLEVRHRSWFAEEPLAEVARLGYSLAEIDLPDAKDHPPANPPRVGPIGYLRVHGRNAAAWFDAKAGRDQRYDYLYPPEEVKELTRVARRLAKESEETFVVTNNHFAGKAVANALEILAELGRTPLAPVELVDAYPRLRSVTRTAGQTSLF